jgi:hypothetical protein
VPKGIMVVQSAPVDPAREDEYNEWYSTKHLPEVCAVPGFTGARRFKLHGGDDGTPPVYLAIYEIDADDITAPVREWRARSASGATSRSDALRLDPPPVVTVYELVD